MKWSETVLRSMEANKIQLWEALSSALFENFNKNWCRPSWSCIAQKPVKGDTF